MYIQKKNNSSCKVNSLKENKKSFTQSRITCISKVLPTTGKLTTKMSDPFGEAYKYQVLFRNSRGWKYTGYFYKGFLKNFKN